MLFRCAPLPVLVLTPQEWGPTPYDPVADLLSGWAAPAAGNDRYDPLASVRAAGRAPAARDVGSKFDPFPSLLSSLSPPAHGGGSSSGSSSKYDPLEAALDAAASWQGPGSGPSKYCPVSAVLLAATEPPSHPAGAVHSSPLAWLLDGWAANSEGHGLAAGGLDPMAGFHDFSAAPPSHQHSKWDPAAEVLSGDWLHSEHSHHLADAASSAASHFFGLEFGGQQQRQQRSLVSPDGTDPS